VRLDSVVRYNGNRLGLYYGTAWFLVPVMPDRAAGTASNNSPLAVTFQQLS
jgi:hypothetical protein